MDGDIESERFPGYILGYVTVNAGIIIYWYKTNEWQVIDSYIR